MQLDDIIFSKIDLMKYTNEIFENLFKDDINLLDYNYSEQAAGYFTLIYEFMPNEYEIYFEHERLMYSIRITRKDKAFTSVNHIYGDEVKNTLNKENIHKSISLLREAIIDDKIVFYHIKKGKQVEVNN